MGLAPVLVEEIFDIIEQPQPHQGTTILLVEQNAQMALQVANRAYVLETGRITISGDRRGDAPATRRSIAAYLGL
jgi:branched-chain amino acid transport system ATP-binding protein